MLKFDNIKGYRRLLMLMIMLMGFGREVYQNMGEIDKLNDKVKLV